MTIVNVCTPGALDPADSFGLIAIELSRHLQRQGAYVNLFALGPREKPFQDEEIAGIIRQPIRPAFGMIAGGYPSTFDQHPGLVGFGRRVGICMFESTKIPTGWDVHMNHCDAIVTPCHFCKEIFVEAGVTTPIHVVPLGINAIYRPAERNPERPLTFLAFIDRGLRKGGIEAQRAFQAAFGDDMNYRLILKGRKSKINASILNPNVELIQEDYSEEQLYQLYLRADVMIAATKGEGFGLLPRQFAATGGIALATNWAGTADDLDQWGVPLDYKLVKADWSHHGRLAQMDLGQWAEVDFDGLVAQLRHVADHRETYARRAMVQAPGVQQLYSWEKFAGEVLEIWKGLG